ncbi:MAG: hypothetical protein IPM64_14140 [Phycisphaerales bacterium]|nr:hypothetical protein [Phycisphaerales bacterium]
MAGRLLIIALILTHATVRDPRCICIADCGPGRGAICCVGVVGSSNCAPASDPASDCCGTGSACCDAPPACCDSDSGNQAAPSTCCAPDNPSDCDACPEDGCPPGCCVVRCIPCAPLGQEPVVPSPAVAPGEFTDGPSWPVPILFASAERISASNGASESALAPTQNLRRARLNVWLN